MPLGETNLPETALADDQGLLSSQAVDLPLRPASEWRTTLAKVIKSVVSLHYTHIQTFDTGRAHYGQATGFVVDKERGYILTNRHVVGSGPFWGYCTFSTHEECDVEVVYFDPVHDFAFVKFDPAAIRHANMEELQLKPEAAQVGVEVRVVGNDSGEVLSISSAVLSRLDRNAPLYSGKFQDFNTNYIQASAASKGGSSGSPVVDIDGNAVALQAGGKSNSSATNFFLPLYRVQRALQLLQKDEKITRGTIQTQWKFESFDICKRLGLNSELEAELRAASPDTNTMLVAERVLPDGPAHGKIQKGDLLIKVNGQLLLSFIELDGILDSQVGETLHLDIRRGDQDMSVSISIHDLHSITPDRFVTISEANFHNLSYQVARCYGIACKGVYCTNSGTLTDLPLEVLVDSVNGKATPDLETFVDVMQNLQQKKDVKISYRKLVDLHTKSSVFVTILTSWSPKIESWTRNEDYKRWTLEELKFHNKSPAPKAQSGKFASIEGLTNPKAAYIANTLVKVNFVTQIMINGLNYRHRTGYGIVVDAHKGLVLCSRAMIPHGLCKITLHIANVEVSAEVKFVHPYYNYALVQYETWKVKAPVESARFSDTPVEMNSKVTMIRVQRNSSGGTATDTTISNIEAKSIGSSTLRPQYRAMNVDAISVETRLAVESSFGVMVDSEGLIQALWLTFEGPAVPSQSKAPQPIIRHGVQAAPIKAIINRISSDEEWTPRVLDMEMQWHSPRVAKKYGVAGTWLEKIVDSKSGNRVFSVRKLSCPAEKGASKNPLEETDIILTLDDELVTDLSGFGNLYDKDKVTATVVRNGEEMVLEIPTVPIEYLETTRAIRVCGAIVQRPHMALRQLMSELPSEVYVSNKRDGTPADLFKLSAVRFITHVNDVETPDLDTFIKKVEEIPDNMFFRLRTMSTSKIPGMVTMKKFDYYFPMKSFEQKA